MTENLRECSSLSRTILVIMLSRRLILMKTIYKKSSWRKRRKSVFQTITRRVKKRRIILQTSLQLNEHLMYQTSRALTQLLRINEWFLCSFSQSLSKREIQIISVWWVQRKAILINIYIQNFKWMSSKQRENWWIGWIHVRSMKR